MTTIGMESMLVASGNGYAGDRTFDGYTVIAEPWPDQDSRHFDRLDGSPGVTYASHSVMLARRADARPHDRELFVLLQHGGGRRVIRFAPCYDHGDTEAALCALPEPVLYSILYAIASGIEQTDRVARTETRNEWAQAYCDGRIRKSRPRQGRRSVTINPKPETPHASASAP